MEILRLLMASPATLTQLARDLEQSPAWIRHHILALEAAGLVEVSEIRKTRRVTEKFYRARAGRVIPAGDHSTQIRQADDRFFGQP